MVKAQARWKKKHLKKKKADWGEKDRDEMHCWDGCHSLKHFKNSSCEESAGQDPWCQQEEQWVGLKWPGFHVCLSPDTCRVYSEIFLLSNWKLCFRCSSSLSLSYISCTHQHKQSIHLASSLALASQHWFQCIHGNHSCTSPLLCIVMGIAHWKPTQLSPGV